MTDDDVVRALLRKADWYRIAPVGEGPLESDQAREELKQAIRQAIKDASRSLWQRMTAPNTP